MPDVNMNNLLEEVAGDKIMKEILNGADKKTAKQFYILMTVLQKHGMTKMETIQIVLELGALIEAAEQNDKI